MQILFHQKDRTEWINKRVRPRIRRGQKSAGKTCRSGLIFFSCHDRLFRSRPLLLIPQEAVCSSLGLHDGTEADSPWRAGVSSDLLLPRPPAGCRGLPLLHLEKTEALKTDQTACTKPGLSTIPEAEAQLLSCLYLVHIPFV